MSPTFHFILLYLLLFALILVLMID